MQAAAQRQRAGLAGRWDLADQLLELSEEEGTVFPEDFPHAVKRLVHAARRGARPGSARGRARSSGPVRVGRAEGRAPLLPRVELLDVGGKFAELLRLEHALDLPGARALSAGGRGARGGGGGRAGACW